MKPTLKGTPLKFFAPLRGPLITTQTFRSPQIRVSRVQADEKDIKTYT